MSYFTLEDVKAHNQKDDCWIAVSDKVYDITDFISTHPGGASILMTVAGEDASDYFYALHKPDILDTVGGKYMIGHLVDYPTPKL